MLKLGNNNFVQSSMINENGYIADHAGALNNVNQTLFASYSPDFTWSKVNNAKSYAILIEDFAASKVIGMPFIHWVALNIKDNFIQANQSYLDYSKWKKSNSYFYSDDILWQGHNSSVNQTLVKNNKINSNLGGILPEAFTAKNIDDSLLYFGCYPPDKDHIYTVNIYALDVEAKDLKYYKDDHKKEYSFNEPFYVGDFIQAISKHTISKQILTFKYKQVK
ncbi:YbhB/YbcL family Raf kinase inhibitor-like protein [Mycoplasma sp. 1018B]|uniref:YbhB/YbcL family Raf kinase inhibitor-like protein n=1 Tax=Mycoplasma sp. 1018B TaxID=2967302 RepID=UPI00211C31F5|nr:YbhB/YbcL family Raf kinase inhibitor-like protein [Mycoplasma sp. 1018B]UUM19439.1 YbhB/YbcL family Raf kinase inhibitor-like protein [Mycoplasma sp. 1018B]